MVGEGATEDFMLKRGDLQTCRTPCQVPLQHSATKKHLFLQDKKSCLKNSKKYKYQHLTWFAPVTTSRSEYQPVKQFISFLTNPKENDRGFSM